jgi:hypothetical protein
VTKLRHGVSVKAPASPSKKVSLWLFRGTLTF